MKHQKQPAQPKQQGRLWAKAKLNGWPKTSPHRPSDVLWALKNGVDLK